MHYSILTTFGPSVLLPLYVASFIICHLKSKSILPPEVEKNYLLILHPPECALECLITVG